MFLKKVQATLNIGAPRYAGNLRQRIKRVAVCGGSGSDLLQTAIQQEADVFVTADISYHTFQAADKRVALIDAGHFETEQPVIRKIVNYLQTQSSTAKEKIHISASTRARNPVQYYLS